MKVLSYNILRGGRGREDALAAVINATAPDICIFQEAYAPDVIESLAQRCHLEHWGASRGHSVAYASRLPVASHVWRRVRWAKRAYLELVLADTGLRIFGVHLSAVHSNLTEQRRAYEIRALLRSVERHQYGLHMVTGDFNTLAPDERLDMRQLPPHIRAFAFVTGRTIHWVTIRLMLEAGYADSYRVLHPSGEGATFPTSRPHVRLDFAFVPESFKSALKRCTVVRDIAAAQLASDHYPLLTELQAESV
jgi:exodeoxyribonuclease-3